MSLKIAVKNIKASGMTVKGWAAKRGFRYQTTVKVIGGYVGKRRIGISGEIVRALNEDGFLRKEV